MRPFVVVFSIHIGNTLAEDILSRDSVAGVVLNRRPEWSSLTKDPRVGYFREMQVGTWTLPQCMAPAIIVFGTEANVGLRLVREAFRRRVRSFLFVEPSFGAIRSHSIYGLVVLLTYRRLGARAISVVRAVDRRATQAAIGSAVLPPLKAVAYAAARRLRGRLLAHRLPGILRRAQSTHVNRPALGDRAILAIGTLGPGGSERQVVNTALALKASGRFHPIVACLDLSNGMAAFYRAPLKQAGIEVVSLSALLPATLGSEDHKRFQAGLANLRQVPDYLKADVVLFLMHFLREKPTIVHAFLDDTNVKAGIAAVLANVPRVILSTRSVAPDNFALHQDYMRPAYRALMALPNVCLSNNSHAGATDYRRWLGNQTPRIEVVHNGIDFAEFAVRSKVDLKLRAVWGVPSNALILGSIMRLSEEKQPVLWARVVVEISRRLPDVHFVLGGGGPLRAEVERIVSQARIQGRVHVLGQVQDPAAVLRALDVFLLTSRLEGLPNVLIEAQAVGVPVVTTPAGGAPETLDPGRTGLVSQDQTVKSVTDTCTTLLTDDELRMRLAEAAPKFVRERFSSEAMVANTLRLYKS